MDNGCHYWNRILAQDAQFLSSLQLLLQKARHRDSDPAAAAALTNFLKAFYPAIGCPTIQIQPYRYRYAVSVYYTDIA